MQQLSLFDHALRPAHRAALLAMEHLRARDFYVAPVAMDQARTLVERLHYAAGASNTGVYLHGLYARTDPAGLHPLGVAWWLPPIVAAARWADAENWRAVLSLHRLAIEPEVPTNGASFLIGRSMRAIRKEGRFKTLLTYADEWQGHRGTIYHATNWRYRGTTRALPVWVDDEGRAVSPKRGPRTLTVQQMRAAGYERAGSFRKHRFVIRA